MKIKWEIDKPDIERFRAFYEQHKSEAFVLARIDRNVNKNLPPFSKELFWKEMITCLLTTQQKSGPDSAVEKFNQTAPFPLNYSKCKTSKNLQNAVTNTLRAVGLRRYNNIGEYAAENFHWLEKEGGWAVVEDIVNNLARNQTASTDQKMATERKSAEIIIYDRKRKDKLKGFGPKQSRNLLQELGLTQYEIPIDSRIVGWLNDKFGFPIKLSATALADNNFYNFILDGFQEICGACGILPCVMDAVIFSSYDAGKDKE